MEQSKFKWYVLHSVSGKEAKLKEYIEKEMTRNPLLQSRVKEIFLPMETRVKVSQGKRTEHQKVSMPGYLFIEADLTGGEVAPTLRFMPNCLGFLGGLDNPTEVPQREIDRMMGAAEASKASTAGISFAVDEVVKVTDGPFRDFTGVVESVDDEKCKVKIAVKIFDRRTSLELSFDQVEREA